jgi:hypothetical protein
MLTYLLEKFDKIKKDRALYCSQIEEEREKEKEKKETRVPTVYDFICKNTRKN